VRSTKAVKELPRGTFAAEVLLIDYFWLSKTSNKPIGLTARLVMNPKS